MQRPLSLANRANDPILPAILEFQSPSQAIAAAPIPRTARGTIWVISSMFAACLTALGLIPIDRVVTAQGKVVSRQPLLVVQPLETSVVRSIDVTEGQSVRTGDVLARLDPTFAAADVGASEALVSTLQAEVSRMQAEPREARSPPQALIQTSCCRRRYSRSVSRSAISSARLISSASTACRPLWHAAKLTRTPIRRARR